MALKIFNTLTRSKEDFIPVKNREVSLYVCGPTVYDYIHMGNGRIFIVFDVVRRFLQYRGYKVTMVQNYTDIDDKMIQRARDEGTTVAELAERFIEAYHADAAALRVRPADIQPRATAHITQIIELIRLLEQKGMAYSTGGDVYFDTTCYHLYGKLSGQKQDELLAGARVEPGEKKKYPLDFVLWKRKKPGEPYWESPWGEGRPGWHIECSAMAMHYLSHTVDIHAGGADLIFPHHENEIAQSSGATGLPFARYWMHGGYLNIEDKKMSKSLGNMLRVRDLLQTHNPLDLRFLILSAHYRSPLNFSANLINQARSGRERLQELADNLKRALPGSGNLDSLLEKRLRSMLDDSRYRFGESMDDDFNTADAIAVLFELARESNIYLKSGHPYHGKLLQEVLDFYEEANEVLGILDLDEPEELAQDILDAIARRNEARERREWSLADQIRDELLTGGIILEDTPHGTRWKKK